MNAAALRPAEEQTRLVLTPHPLQRVGAYALAALAGQPDPEKMSAEAFGAAMATVTADAERASVRDSKAIGFLVEDEPVILPELAGEPSWPAEGHEGPVWRQRPQPSSARRFAPLPDQAVPALAAWLHRTVAVHEILNGGFVGDAPGPVAVYRGAVWGVASRSMVTGSVRAEHGCARRRVS